MAEEKQNWGEKSKSRKTFFFFVFIESGKMWEKYEESSSRKKRLLKVQVEDHLDQNAVEPHWGKIPQSCTAFIKSESLKAETVPLHLQIKCLQWWCTLQSESSGAAEGMG